jgi:hypothetical protein
MAVPLNEDTDESELGVWEEFLDTIEGAIEYLKECQASGG